jgi:hypothetical protein
MGEWVDLDPKWLVRDPETGELYADATHIKFGYFTLDKDMFREMVKVSADVIGRLTIEIINLNY